MPEQSEISGPKPRFDEAEFKRRTRGLAIGIIQLVREIPREMAGDVLSRQLIRSATSVGANYRAACRGRSVADVIARLGVVEEEADETMYWLELIRDAGLLTATRIKPHYDEANEITAMTVASIRTLRIRQHSASKVRPSS